MILTLIKTQGSTAHAKTHFDFSRDSDNKSSETVEAQLAQVACSTHACT